MDRTNGRNFPPIGHDTKHNANRNPCYSASATNKRHFNDDPKRSYSRTRHEKKIKVSGNHNSNGNRSSNITSGKQNSVELILASGSSAKPKSSGNGVAKFVPTEYDFVNTRLTENRTAELTSVQISAVCRTVDYILTQDDTAKCQLMKVYFIIEPKLRQLLHWIFQDKQDSETLEMYLERFGMQSKLQKNFSEEQMKKIRSSTNFNSFDSTLLFRCIEILRDINPILKKNENLKRRIDNTMKELKSPRNLFSHNRTNLTAELCQEKASNLKRSLEDLIDIIYIWDRKMNITSEKMKIWKDVEAIMNDRLSVNDISYMRLLNVINCTAESVLDEVTSSLCKDKQEMENFRDYFKRKEMKNYKDTFFKQEKELLESNKKVQPDLTLYCKIINACGNWHPSIKYDGDVKTELTNILSQIRGIRNNVIHNMLSIPSIKCNEKAQELRSHLKNLTDLVNFIQS